MFGVPGFKAYREDSAKPALRRNRRVAPITNNPGDYSATIVRAATPSFTTSLSFSAPRAVIVNPR